MNLITSEQENHTLESKPYGDVLVFSTQDPSLAQHKPKKRKERKKWSLTEDLVLISAWLNTSKDPVVGNAYWSRVAAYYAASPKVAGLEKREAIHCKPRWHKINNQVCKFVASYETARKKRSSGHNDDEDDVIKLAYEIFFNDYKKKFTLEHAWRELRHDTKWCGSSSSTSKDNGASKRRKCDDQSAQSSIYVPVEEDQARPPSVKANKSVSKTRAVQEEGNPLFEFKSMWEIKKTDLEISKNKLLDSLLAKAEPLSKMEMALKNKLITDLLSNS